MDKELQELLDFINHPDFVEPPKYAPKTLRLCGLKLKDAEESIKYWEEHVLHAVKFLIILVD